MQQTSINRPPLKPTTSSQMQMLIGDEVFKLLSEQLFQVGWDNLYNNCSWCTVFQSRAFVDAWYNVYKNVYTPIIVKSEKEGKLTGLLTLVLSEPRVGVYNGKRIRGKIEGAGQYEAEYQTWISEEDTDNTFITKALALILERFPHCSIFFRFIPALVPLQILKNDPQLKGSLVLHTCSRPLIDFNAPDISKLFNKREFRNKLNRLKKLGELAFEQITDKDEFSAILNELTIQYDFRQGAMFNKNQFRENPLKAKLLQAMFERNLLHASVLKVNGTIVASIVAITGKGWVHLGGINIHSPFNAKLYSPGFVHFIMLGQQLTLNGTDVFDLTPGGDSYKERMANKHDQVYELIFTNNLFFKLKKLLRSKAHTQMYKAGLRPMSLDLSIRKIKYLAKGKIKSIVNQRALLTLYKRIKGLFYPEKEVIVCIDNINLNYKPTIVINGNSLSDLLDYKQEGLSLTRWEFLEDAMRRLERGEHSFTWSQDSVLKACAWLSTSKPGDALPADAAVLQGLYIHSKSSEQLGEFLQNVAFQARKVTDQEKVYVRSDAYNNAVERALRLGIF